MENQIVCPKCRKTIVNNPIIEDVIKGEGSAAQFILCDCGEKITYWKMTAQLRKQKSFGYKFQNWVRNLTHSQG